MDYPRVNVREIGKIKLNDFTDLTVRTDIAARQIVIETYVQRIDNRNCVGIPYDNISDLVKILQEEGNIIYGASQEEASENSK